MLRRWMVERTFCWFGRNRQLAKDFDKHAATLACFVTLASIQAARQGLGRSPRCTATKVGKSDCEGTFAAASGNGKVASIPAVLSIALEPLCLTESSPLRATSSRANNPRVSAQVMLPTGSQTADVTLPKNPLTAGAGGPNLHS